MTTTSIIIHPTYKRDAQTLRAAAIIRDNHHAHAVHLPDIIYHPAYMPSSPTYTETAGRALYHTLRYLHAQDGNPLMLEMLQAWSTDTAAASLAQLAEAEADHLRAWMEHHEAAKSYKRIARNLANPAEDRAAALLDTYRHTWAADAAAAGYKASRAAVAAVISTAYTDRADLLQVAIMEQYTHGDFSRTCRAIRQAVRKLANPNALYSVHTDWSPISKEEYDAAKAAHPDELPLRKLSGLTAAEIAALYRPAHIPAAKGDGYYTYQWSEGSKPRRRKDGSEGKQRRPAGYYRIHHRRTLPPYISYEAWTSGEDAPKMADNGGINAITDQQAAEDIRAMIDAAGLSASERGILLHVLDNTAAATANAAAAAAAKEGKPFTPSDYVTTLWKSALRRWHVYAQDAQQDARKLIEDKLSGTEYSRISRIRDKMRKGRDTVRKAAAAAAMIQTKRPDLIAAVAAAAAAAPAPQRVPYYTVHGNPVYADITWSEYHQPQPITDEQRKAEAAAADLDRRKRDALQSYTAAATSNRTAYAAHNAAAAAAVFMADLAGDALALTILRSMDEMHQHNAAKAAAAAAEAAAKAAAEEQRKAAADAAKWERFNTNMARWEAAQAKRKAEQEAAAAAKAEESRRKLEAYNTALRAALHGKAWKDATPDERAAATTAAKKAAE